MRAGKRRTRFTDASRGLIVVLAVSLLIACGGGGETSSSNPASYVEVGDLPALSERGSLRILMPPLDSKDLPRRGYTLDLERDLARRLARNLGLEPNVILVSRFDQLLPALLEGKGDLVVARLTATQERRARVRFSVPIGYVREVVVCRTDGPPLDDLQDLSGLRVAVRPSSSYHGTLLKLKSEIPGIEIVEVPEHLDTEQIIYRVWRGDYDATLADEDIFDRARAYLPELHAPFAVTGERPIAWAMRPGSRQLKEAVDRFLHEQAMKLQLDEVLFGDLDAIRQRRALRVLTLNSAATYFFHRGRQMGFEFELTRRFAKEIGCRIHVVVPPSADLLIPWLLGGRGDLIATSMTVLPDRERQVAFTRPYNHVGEVVVARAGDDISGPEGLQGRAVVVRKSSSYYRTVRALKEGADFELVEAPEELTTEEIIAKVASSEYDLTVADENIVDVELTYRDDVRKAFHVGETRRIAWAVRPQDVGLREAADRFIERTYRGAFYNVLKERYFENKRTLARLISERPERHGEISPYDELFRRYGRMVEVDWRLLAAQAFEESRFDPRARSWAGALGLMQVMPTTANELGVDGDLRDPETAVRAGALYFRWLMDRFEPTLPHGTRLRFALASYNAGRGHIQDGRRLAREAGLDPNRWFGNVEKVLPLLAKPEYAQRARFGYCRCRQPVEYVRRINERYIAYVQAVY